MTQQELSGIVAEKIQTSEERTNEVLVIILSVISEELSENGAVDIDDFGVLKTQKRSEYISLNSKTGERMLMPPSIEIVFKSYLSNYEEAKLDVADNEVQGYINSDILIFEPDLSLKNRINSAFINFEPTMLNEGVELPDLTVISNSPEILEPSTLEDASAHEYSLTSEDMDISEKSETDLIQETFTTPESRIASVSESESGREITDPKHVAVGEKFNMNLSINETPPIKQRTRNSRIWVPIVGGVAITLATLFFFNGTAKKRSK